MCAMMLKFRIREGSMSKDETRLYERARYDEAEAGKLDYPTMSDSPHVR